MRTILFVALLLGAAPAWADWLKVAETADTVYYVDPASIGDKGDWRRVSVLQDFAKQEPGGTRSRRVSYEIDCAGRRIRSLAGTDYSEPMAQGTTVTAWERESEWLYVAPKTGSNMPPRTPYRQILAFACSR